MLIFQIRSNDESKKWTSDQAYFLKIHLQEKKKMFRYQVLGVGGQGSKRVKEPRMHVWPACKLSKHHQSREWDKVGTKQM